MRRKAKTIVPPLQQADFDALPISVQRKQFSSLERLQIRQSSLDDQNASNRSRSSSSTAFRPSLTLVSRRTRKPEDVPSGPEISQAEIGFFLSLPDKLRKLYYSRAEVAAILNKCEQEFLPNDHAVERAQQRFSDFQFGFKRDPNSTSEQHLLRTRSRSLSLSADSSVSPRQALFGTYTQEEEGDTESSLFYLDTMSPPTSSKSNRPRRTMSLTASSMHYSSSSALVMSNPAGFALAPAPRGQRQHSSSMSGRRSLQTPTPPLFDPEATHYQDPETRKKLRTYLVSPQKFDEAIEFGFPSASDNDGVTPHYQLPPITNHSRKFSRDMHTFLRDGKLSFFEELSHENQGLESDEDSVADADSPATPSSPGHSFRLHSRQISHSRMSPVDHAPLSPTYQKSGNLNREMTLRMTLTRPDLRANDDELYGWQPSSPKPPKDDPLALEDLVLTDDMTGTKGAFYVKPKPRGNLVTRMLKRASLKGR